MGRSLADIVAAPSWITVGWRQRRYRLSPLTLRDWGSLERWLCDHLVQRRFDAAEGDEPRWRVYDRAWLELNGQDVSVFNGSPAVDGADEFTFGVAFGVEMVRLSLDHFHPGIGTEGAASVVRKCRDPDTLMRVVLRISGAAADPDAPPERPTGKQRGRGMDVAKAVAMLAATLGKSPNEVADMTLPQAEATLGGAATGGSGVINMPLKDYAAWHRRYLAERELEGGD